MNIAPRDLLDILDYDPLTGALTWKVRPLRFFLTGRPTREANMNRWNRRHAGHPVQPANRDGYVCFSLFGKMVRAHRVIWALMTGEWPPFEVDHRDGNRSNNAWTNLRAAPEGLNAANRGPDAGSTSKHVGVSWIKAHGKWRAQIGHRGKNLHLSYFATEDAAAQAYTAKARELRGEWARASA